MTKIRTTIFATTLVLMITVASLPTASATGVSALCGNGANPYPGPDEQPGESTGCTVQTDALGSEPFGVWWQCEPEEPVCPGTLYTEASAAACSPGATCRLDFGEDGTGIRDLTGIWIRFDMDVTVELDGGWLYWVIVWGGYP